VRDGHTHTHTHTHTRARAILTISPFVTWYFLTIFLKKTVTRRLKTRIMEPEETSTVRQRLGKRVSAATDTQATIDELLGRCFLFCDYKREFSRESEVEFRSSKWAKWAVSRELSSVTEAEKMALWVQLAVGLWREKFMCAVIQLECCSSCIKIRCQETDGGDCNRLRILLCVTVNCGNNDGVTVVYITTCKWSVNPVIQNPRL
jgi:hypothetical protein